MVLFASGPADVTLAFSPKGSARSNSEKEEKGEHLSDWVGDNLERMSSAESLGWSSLEKTR